MASSELSIFYGDQYLVDRMRQGEQQAFEEFFDTYAPRVGAFAARRISLDAAALEDVVQVTMIKAMQGLRGFRGGAALFTWLCQICRNHLADVRRNSSRQPATQSLEQLLAARPHETPAELTDLRDPIEECAAGSTCRAVRRAINQLPSNYARILELRYGDELSILELAKILRLSESATESRLVRARQAFRDLWEPEFAREQESRSAAATSHARRNASVREPPVEKLVEVDAAILVGVDRAKADLE